MNVPIRAFWMMINQMPRIEADEQMRSLSAVSYGMNGGDKLKEYYDRLDRSMGEIVAKEPALDEDGWSTLKQMAK